MTKEIKALLLGLLAITCFALTLPFTSHAVKLLNPIFISGARVVIAAVISIVVLIIARQKFPARHHIKYIFVGGFCVTVAFPLLIAIAMQDLPASHGGVVLGTLPLATMMAGRLLTNERPSIAFWLTAILGSLLVVVYSLLQGSGELHLADLALIIAVIGLALGYALGAVVSKEINGSYVICWMIIFSLPWGLPMTFMYIPPNLLDIPLATWGSVAYLACFSQLFSFFFWYNSLAMGGISRISQLQLLQPFITIGVAIPLLNEYPDGLTIVFALAVVFTVAINRYTNVNQSVTN